VTIQQSSGAKVAFIGFEGNASSSSTKIMEYALTTFGLTLSTSPDIVFVKEDYFSIRKALLDYPARTTRILFTGEMQGANFDLFDYVIGWEIGEFAGRYARMHPALREWRTLDLANKFDAKSSMQERLFCDFIFSNGNHFGPRDDFFRILNQRSRVDSLGLHLRNTASPAIKLKPFAPGWELEKIKVQSRYKFSIAIENGVYNGYTTEKIMTSVLAGSIPIYWGNPDIGLDFNSERLINLDNFESLDKAAKYVIDLSHDQIELERIASLPLMTDKQLFRVQESESDILSLIGRAINSASNDVLRRPRGTSVAQRESLIITRLSKDQKLKSLRGYWARVFFKIRSLIPFGIQQFIRRVVQSLK
jgi:hypothetical protein